MVGWDGFILVLFFSTNFNSLNFPSEKTKQSQKKRVKPNANLPMHYALFFFAALCHATSLLRNASFGTTQFRSHRVNTYDAQWENMNESSCDHGSNGDSTLYPFYYSELMVINNFSFDIPPRANITSIRQYWVVQDSSSATPHLHEFEVSLIKNASNYRSTKYTTSIPAFTPQEGWQTFDITLEYPKVGNDLLWNASWTSEEINSEQFGVGIRVTNPSGSNKVARISCVYIDVGYSLAFTQTQITEQNSSEVSGETSGETSTSESTSSVLITSSLSTNSMINSSVSSTTQSQFSVIVIVLACLGFLFLIALGGFFYDKLSKMRAAKKKAGLLIPYDTDSLYLKNVEIGDIIGEGNFGKVFKGKLNDTMDVACKVLKNETLLDNFKFNEEASILSKLKHENVLRFYGLYTADTHTYLVTEYLKMGSLQEFLLKGHLDGVSGIDKLTLILTIASGMHYLQTENITHGDLRAQNLLITKVEDKYTVKISDFGLAKHIDQYLHRKIEKFIPIKWVPPEVITSKSFTRYSDIWSFGVVIWEISHGGKTPYQGVSNNNLANELLGGYRLELKKGEPTRCLARLVSRCWGKVAYERPEFIEAYREIETAIKTFPSTELPVKIYAPLPLFNEGGEEIYNAK